MEDKKKKLIRTYYYSLIILLVTYFVTALVLNSMGIFIIADNVIPFLIVTILYYIIGKNTLSAYMRKKIEKIDPELKSRESKLDGFKNMVSNNNKEWYKNGTLIYVIVVLSVVILFAIYQN